MPKGFQILVPDDWKLTKEEVTDATLSITRKHESRPFGEYARRLAEVLRTNVKIPKGHWQAYWTVATRVFSFVYGGHNEKTVIAVGRALGEELGIGAGEGEKIARAVYVNADYILGKKAKMETIETTRARR